MTHPENPDVGVPPELRAGILEAARTSHSPTRREVQRRDRALLVAGAVLTAALYVVWRVVQGNARTETRSLDVVLLTTLGTVAIALAAAWMSITRGRTMLGYPRHLLLATSVLVPVLYVAWKGAVTPAWQGLAPPGWFCLGLSLVLAAPLLAAFAHRWKGSDPAHPRVRGAALSVAAGAWATVLVDLWCPFANPAHLLLGHLVPLAVLGATGLVWGARFLAVRTRAYRTAPLSG